MLFLVAQVDIQVHQQFLHAQQTHHQDQNLFQVVQKLVDHTDLTDLALMELSIQQELVAELVVLQLGLKLAAPLLVVLGVLGSLPLVEFKKDTGHVYEQTAQPTLTQRLDVQQAAPPHVEGAVDQEEQLPSHAQQQLENQTARRPLLHLHKSALKHCLWYNFYMDDAENINLDHEKPQRVFALISDGDVFHKWYIDEDYDNPGIAALIYGLQSGPTVVDVTDKNHEEIDFGWTYDGESFYPENSGVDNE